MPKAIRIHKNGGPEVLNWEDVAVGDPGPGEVRIKQHAVGLNFIDVYFRTGLYPQPLPAGLGMEAAGVIEAVGDGVTHVKAGDRVAYAGGPTGAYAEVRVMPAGPLIKLPDAISFETGAAMMLQGMTVRYLIKKSYPVKAGETVLLHAAAGGIGLIACQWLKSLGVTVIGTVSSAEKAALAKAHGCTHTINYTTEDFTAKVKELTGGKGVPVVYDSIGKDTWEGSLNCLQPLGHMITFGNASGPVPPVALTSLSAKGSIYVQRPTLNTYASRRDWLEEMAGDLIDAVTTGKVKIEINQRVALKDAGQAQAALEARKTTGCTVLMP
ncbi:MAG: Alcohol dehydrogenase zinc-binding domain protein [Betaproteobacteria bacterium]|nr:Alcohol dehydrogenase zinc-binding domain protein [Betaproteobacteria bacterium]